MTLKFIEGFETYANAVDLEQAFPGSPNHVGFTFPTGRRTGTKCLDWDVAYTTSWVYTPVNVDTFVVSEYAIVGFAFKVLDFGSTFDIEFYLDNGNSGDGGGVYFAFKGGTSNIGVYRCKQFGVELIDFILYELNTWNYFEIKVKIGDGTDGHIVARLNEQELINWTGDNYHLGTTGLQVSRFNIFFKQYWHIQIDDMYFAGSNGSYNNDFLGDIRVDVIHPNGAGNHTDFIPSAGNNYECVDEVIIDESDYIEGGNVGEIDSYSYPDVPTDIDNAGIFAVDLRTISQRTATSDNIKIDGLIRTGSTDYNASADLSLSDSWSNKNFIFERDPSDSNPWTQAKINACEFGMEVA